MIDHVVGNVIFTLHLVQDHPVLRVSDDEPTARLPVTISADRCDPHAVAEFKTPTCSSAGSRSATRRRCR